MLWIAFRPAPVKVELSHALLMSLVFIGVCLFIQAHTTFLGLRKNRSKDKPDSTADQIGQTNQAFAVMFDDGRIFFMLARPMCSMLIIAFPDQRVIG